MDAFSDEEELVRIPLYSSADMNVILSGGTPNNQPRKNRRLPGYRQYTRKLDGIFDVEVHAEHAAEFYRLSVPQ